VSRIDGCEQTFYKDLYITGNVLTQFYKYAYSADILLRTTCRLIKKKTYSLPNSEIYHIWYSAWLTSARVQNRTLFISVYLLTEKVNFCHFSQPY